MKIINIVALLLVLQFSYGQVTKTLTYSWAVDANQAQKYLVLDNRIRGNVILQSNTEAKLTINVAISASDQAQADSVSMTNGETESAYTSTIDSSQNPPVNSPNSPNSPSSQLSSGSGTNGWSNYSLFSILASLILVSMSAKMSGSSQRIATIGLLFAFGITLSSSQADLSTLRADVTILVPTSSYLISGFNISAYQGRVECLNSLTCNVVPSPFTPPGADGLIKYWLAEEERNDGQVGTTWDDSTLCVGPWPNCPAGIICTAAGIKKFAFFSDSVMEYRFNYATSSDFNDRGSFTIDGDLITFNKTESWSCAHPKAVADFDTYWYDAQTVYFRFKIEGGKLWISGASGSIPSPAAEITSWTIYRSVSREDYYSKYFIAICQACQPIVGCGGTNPDCTCKCHPECLRLTSFGTYCPNNKRGMTIIDEHFLLF